MAVLLTSDISYWADMLTVSLCKLLYSVKGCSHAQVHPAGIRRVVSVHIANKDSDHTENTNSYWIKFKLPLAEAVSKPFGFSITSLTLWNWSWAVRLSWVVVSRALLTTNNSLSELQTAQKMDVATVMSLVGWLSPISKIWDERFHYCHHGILKADVTSEGLGLLATEFILDHHPFRHLEGPKFTEWT